LRIAVAPLASLGRDGKAPWRMVAEYDDAVSGLLVHGDRLYLYTFKNAPNFRIVSVPLAAPVLADARVEVAEDPANTLENMAAARDGLYVARSVDGRTQIERRDWSGAAATLALPYEGWVYDLETDPLADGVTLDIDSWTRPDTFFTYDAAKRAFSPAGFGTTSAADYSGIVAEETEATSADGTKVPLSILHRKDLALDGSHPALVYGYAGYGISQNPAFSPTRLAWLERGGVFAICHARGGSEKGHRWQEDGTHEHKMNGVRDFIACGEALIERRLTSKSKLVGQAGSMGGILIGRAITERPDLFAAANIAVGIVNPLRTLAAENGANQKAELGDPETPAGYRSILAMDPYQHVIPGTPYPAVLFTVGLHDGRVAPWMTGKMAARMMTATTSGRPILIRVEPDAGHGIGSTRDQAYAERADVWSFFLAAVGEPGFAAGGKE